MKKILLSLIAILTVHYSNAQNTFPASGNAGIGITTPTSGLTIQTEGSNDNDGALFLVNSTNAGFGGFATLAGIKAAGGDGQYNFLRIQNTAGTKFLITGTGNVAIGTTNPQGYMLAVNGSAIATSMTVKLNTNWPDYVFKSTYQLPSLKTVKLYIDQNHHLPNVPSAEQVAKDGLNLGDMNKITMQKVEELTLYLIEKDKELNNERQINNHQQQEIDNQKSIVNQQSKELQMLQEQVDQLMKLTATKNASRSN